MDEAAFPASCIANKATQSAAREKLLITILVAEYSAEPAFFQETNPSLCEAQSVLALPGFHSWSAVLIQKPGTVIVLKGRNLCVIPVGAGQRARICVLAAAAWRCASALKDEEEAELVFRVTLLLLGLHKTHLWQDLLIIKAACLRNNPSASPRKHLTAVAFAEAPEWCQWAADRRSAHTTPATVAVE